MTGHTGKETQARVAKESCICLWVFGIILGFQIVLVA